MASVDTLNALRLARGHNSFVMQATVARTARMLASLGRAPRCIDLAQVNRAHPARSMADLLCADLGLPTSRRLGADIGQVVKAVRGTNLVWVVAGLERLDPARDQASEAMLTLLAHLTHRPPVPAVYPVLVDPMAVPALGWNGTAHADAWHAGNFFVA